MDIFLLLLSLECFMFLEMRFKNFSPIKNVFLENRKLWTNLAMLQGFELTFFNINDYISNSRLFGSNKGFIFLFMHIFYTCTEFLIWIFFFLNKSLINSRFLKSLIRLFILAKFGYVQRTVSFLMFSLVGKIFWISDDVFSLLLTRQINFLMTTDRRVREIETVDWFLLSKDKTTLNLISFSSMMISRICINWENVVSCPVLFF